MNATSNPQTAAERGRKNYRDVTTPDTTVPETMVEKAVDQSREVYDRSKDALDASISTFERTFDAAGQGAAAFNRKIIDIDRPAERKFRLRPGQELGRRQEPLRDR